MKKCVNGKMVDMTAEEIAEQRKAEITESRRPLTESEVSRMLITEQINTLSVDDNTALRMRGFYPEWQTDKAYSVGYKVQYGGLLYKVITAHTSQADWTPDVAVTLFVRIDEVHSGTADDPITYDGNMVLESGLHYTQNGDIYLCTRATETAVHNALSELVGLYVEMI